MLNIPWHFPGSSSLGQISSMYKKLMEISKRVVKDFNISILDINYISLNEILSLLKNEKE